MNGFGALLLRWSATLGLVLIATIVAAWLWRQNQSEPWTRDGHVRADVVRVTTDVPGLITEVHVRDNQAVAAGQVLFVVDRPRYTAALVQADASVASARAELDLARREVNRDLVLDDLVATETHEQNIARMQTARTTLDQASAGRSIAALNLERTEVHASVNGVVTNLDLHPGDYLAAGAQVMALIDTDSLRVEGYFEETKLRRIRVGDAARVSLMGEPEVLEGHVESIAAGIADDQVTNTGNLLPAVAPTFSWVRLAERIPVRVHLDRMPPGTALIAGRTATVTVLPTKAP
jgi:RND family efflux transporter MFP subunit